MPEDKSSFYHLAGQLESQQEDFLALAEDNEELWQFGNWNWSPRTDIVKWSRGMFVLMDFDPDEERTEITMDFYRSHIIPEDRTQMKAAFDAAALNKGKTVEFKHTVITNRQREKILFSRGKIVYDKQGEVKNIMGITHDITESTLLANNLKNYKRMVMEPK